MKKHEYILNKNKCKDPKSIRYVRYIKVVSIAIILFVLIYTAVMAQVTKVDFAHIISENVTITCGFILAMQALLTFYLSKRLVLEMSDLEYFESNRLKLLLITISSFATTNYITGVLGILTLVKFYRWKGFFSFSDMFQKTKEENRLNECILLLIVYLVLCVLELILGSMVLG